MNDFKKQTYSDQVAEHVRNEILNGNLPPGAAISEVAIAEELSISRAPVREAMQILIREGLIVSHPQKRKHVKALTAKQIKNSYFTGGVLEAAAVARVLEQYTKEDFLELERIVAEMKAIADTNGLVSDQVPLDNEFHDILFSRIDNNLIVELCRRACQGISKFLLYTHWVKLYTAQQVYKRHRKIIDALRTKDPVTIEQVIRDHYTTSGERMSAYGADVYDG
ncbi:MAG: GntR family transcriptional regulator [Desulfobacterales bacterium]|nr:GntR family transcriptional regulator [Desulfobacterales bacterium]